MSERELKYWSAEDIFNRLGEVYIEHVPLDIATDEHEDLIDELRKRNNEFWRIH